MDRSVMRALRPSRVERAARPGLLARGARSRRVFHALLDDGVTDARIALRDAEGETILGRGAGAPSVAVRVHDPRFFGRVLARGNLGLGEAYMDGDFDVEGGELADLLAILLRNRLGERVRHPALVLAVLALRLRNALRGGTGNVRWHYDAGPDLFASFLDPTLTYSCGYVSSPDDDLETQQQTKLDRICRKLRLGPGQHLLDVGCGFGGLLLHAARHHGVTGVGVTLSRDQADVARARIRAAGLAERLRVEIADYREVSGTFDRIASVGMLEHVPARELPTFFRHLDRVLGRRGIALVHAIGRSTLRNSHDPFIQRYIFPRSNTPSLSEIATALERRRLVVVDVENVARHYRHTTRAWLQRFREHAGRLDPVRYDRRFRRMWEYYLSCGIATATAAADATVYQVLFTRDYPSDVWLARV